MSIFDKYDLVDVEEGFPIPDLPSSGVVVVVGSSGSGKSTILKHWGCPIYQEYDTTTPIYKLFPSEEEAERLLLTSGLRSIPCWRRPLSELSNGERHRAVVALSLQSKLPFIDEFTSVVDRDTAKALCFSISKAGFDRLVIASCHRDILQWIEADYIYDTDSKQWLDRGCLRHDTELSLHITPCETEETWELFKRHHYLSGKINKGAVSWVALHGGKPIAFVSSIAYPSGSVKNAYREHRTVVLPEFQGMGIGNRVSEEVAQHFINQGCRYFSKTSHPSMGIHRNNSRLWKPTSKNMKARKDYKSGRKTKEDGHKHLHAHRVCYSHEYVGGDI